MTILEAAYECAIHLMLLKGIDKMRVKWYIKAEFGLTEIESTALVWRILVDTQGLGSL